MGCHNTKSKTYPDGLAADPLEEPAAPPPTDPRLPLDARQVFKLQKSWKAIKRNMLETGLEMFIRLFQENEELKYLFKGFKHLKTSDELRENEVFEQHAGLVMGVIDDAISHIADVDYVIELCQRTGKTHRRFPGFTAQLFWNMEGPFIHAIKLLLQDRYTEQMAHIYQTTIHWVIGFLVEYGPTGMEQNSSPINDLAANPPANGELTGNPGSSDS